MTVDKIVSGGQTGVYRAALDVAIELDIPHGGWCPQGRRAEDGRINEKYALTETPSRDYFQRTEWNVRGSDATLIFTHDTVEGGTAATVDYARQHDKPFLIIDLSDPSSQSIAIKTARTWLNKHHVQILNVAGPRHSKQPAIYQQSREFLQVLLNK